MKIIECINLKELNLQYNIFVKKMESFKKKNMSEEQTDIIDEIIEEFSVQYYLDEFLQFEK